MIYQCPVCSEKLNREEKRLVCPKNHSFDLSKEGYCNLLFGGGDHGDNKEMVLARRAFLSKGYYSPLAEKIASTVEKHARPFATVLDSGCGEGYYTDTVEKRLSERDAATNLYGFDISKDAVKAAAKRNKSISLSVASAYRQPYRDGSVDVIYNVFSPLAIDEVKRVLSKDGVFIMAIPDELHLYELKAKVYDNPYKNTVADTEIQGFELLSNEPVHYTMELSSKEDIISLFGMTPYAYRTKKENADRLLSLDSLAVSAHFRILIYRKV